MEYLAMNRKCLLLSLCLLATSSMPIGLAAQQNVSPAMAKLLDQRDDKRCKELGAVPKTEAYVNCRLQLQQMMFSQMQVQQQYEQQLLTQQQTQRAYVPPPRAYIPPTFVPYQIVRTPKTIHCQTDAWGNTLTTDCQQY
jgi:hypothetical protein